MRKLSGSVPTSVSDNEAYPQLCLQASRDDRVFADFRRNPIYNEILEHVTEEQGRQYLDLIARDPDLLGAMDEFRCNDLYGNPGTHTYPSVGAVSPSTLRYIKVLADLKEHFRTLDDLDICEIGVGYGGQCRIIHAYFKPASYTLLDIGPALALARRFLEHYAQPRLLFFHSMEEMESRAYDLVMSNYAFTELPRSIQESYLQRVILRSSRGYITYNEITPPQFRSYKAEELLALIPGATRIKEEPLTHTKNCIIVWGR
jgi:hypothetical protein